MAIITETHEIGTTKSTFTSIPVLDLSLIESPASKPIFLSKLRDALVLVGFFYLKNTSISADVQKAFVQKSIDLCNLPLEKKLEIDMVKSKHFLGYSRLGHERTARKLDHREMFDVSEEFNDRHIPYDGAFNLILSSSRRSLLQVQTSRYILTSKAPIRYAS